MLICADMSLTIPYRAVNGRLDLVNLFPVKLDLKPFVDAWGSAATFRISAPDGSLHFCGVDVAPERAGAIQTEDVYTTTGDPLYAAGFVEMPQGEAQIAPADYLGNCDDPRCSNFFKYFTRSFEILGLKRVISTSYAAAIQDYGMQVEKLIMLNSAILADAVAT